MNLKNAQYMNAANTIINVMYQHPTFGWIPFTANKNDSNALSRQIFTAAAALKDIVQYNVPAATTAAFNQAKADKLAQLTSKADSLITGGYHSSALGTDHVYPSGVEDQANMIASVTSSLMPNLPANWTTPFTCVTPDHVSDVIWPLVDHTAAQIQQAGEDGKTWILSQRTRLKQLIGQLIDPTVTTVAQVNAINW